MESNLISAATSQGIFAGLFVALLFYVLRNTAIRELKYQTIIEKLSDNIESTMKSIDSKIDQLM